MRIAERSVARDDLVATTRRQAGPHFVVESGELRPESRSTLGTIQLGSDRSNDAGESHRVEPDMGVERALLLARSGKEVLTVEQVERRPRAARNGLLQRRLEPASEVEDEVGAAHILDVRRSELDVVGLRAWRREILDVDVLAPDLRGRPGKRIERCHDRGPGSRALIGPAASGEREQHEREEEERPLHRSGR